MDTQQSCFSGLAPAHLVLLIPLSPVGNFFAAPKLAVPLRSPPVLPAPSLEILQKLPPRERVSDTRADQVNRSLLCVLLVLNLSHTVL